MNEEYFLAKRATELTEKRSASDIERQYTFFMNVNAFAACAVLANVIYQARYENYLEAGISAAAYLLMAFAGERTQKKLDTLQEGLPVAKSISPSRLEKKLLTE